MSEDWISHENAVDLIKRHCDASIGRAQAMLKAAIASDEVRTKRLHSRTDPVLLTADDGIIGMNLRPGALRKYGVTSDGITAHLLLNGQIEIRRNIEISGDDLLDWLRRFSSPRSKRRSSRETKRKRRLRYASDAPLIEEGRALVAAGMSKLQAAKKLASRAEGGTLETRTRRLRGLF